MVSDAVAMSIWAGICSSQVPLGCGLPCVLRKNRSCHTHGGWHDAGDYGRYIINSGITTGTLLWAWELYGASLHDFALQIPESGSKVPDFLAEIQWNLQWMLLLQDKDGGVWQKQSRDDYCSFIMPQDELGPNYVIGTGSAPYKGTCATADLAAVMAIAARCYSSYAPAFSQQCLNAARAAWSWCQNNPNVFFKNPAGIHTAEFGDSDCHDELLWAAAELWRTTGDAAFHQAFLREAAGAVSFNHDRCTVSDSSRQPWILELCIGPQKGLGCSDRGDSTSHREESQRARPSKLRKRLW